MEPASSTSSVAPDTGSDLGRGTGQPRQVTRLTIVVVMREEHLLGVRAAVVDGQLVPGDVRVAEGRVVGLGLPPAAAGLAVPAFVDLQLNGYAGVDFNSDPAGRWDTARVALARDGVGRFVANVITASPADQERAVRVAARVVAGQRARELPDVSAARLVGAHLEGPFLSRERAGTHPVAHLRDPDPSLLDALLQAGPVVGLTIAPELPGAPGLIRYAGTRGLLVALGHSAATEAEADRGFDAGASTVTHLFNGMSPLTGRNAGLAGVALARDDVTVQLICDRVHLSEMTIRLALRAAAGRWVLVTDAIAATGRPDGRYRLGGVEVTVRAGTAARADGTLAGSVLTLPQAVRNVVGCGAERVDSVNAVTVRPAALLGLGDYPRLRPGDPADLVVLDEELEVTARWTGDGRLWPR